ncbi:MAG: TonB-dependent receptor [Treponema sp.]|jgi:outer membrane receptor for ferrienterochelin and colicins|nr:TonB-dependent receptor [Treponema sp.]
MKVKGFVLCAAVLFASVYIHAEEKDGYIDFGDESEGMVFTATRTGKRLTDTPVVTEVITGEEIENSSAATLAGALDDYGLVFRETVNGHSIQMQGLERNRVLVLVDGRRVIGRFSQALNGDTLPLATVERIEIVRGPQSALYGSDALGGVINVVTKKPSGTVSWSASLANHFFPGYGETGAEGTVEPSKKINPLRGQDFNAALMFPAGKLSNSLDMEASRGSYYFDEERTVSILPKYYRGRLGFDSLREFENGADLRFGGSAMFMREDRQTSAAGNLHRTDYLRAGGYAAFSLTPFSGGVLTVTAGDDYYQRNRDEYGGVAGEWIRGEKFENENLAFFEASGIYDGFDNWVLTAGLDASFNSMVKYNLKQGLVFRDREALFFQGEYCKPKGYSIAAGLRLERDSRFGFAAAPKLSVMSYMGGNFRLFAGAGLGYRSPDFSDLYMMEESMRTSHVYGNENLKPEYCLSCNLGFEWVQKGGFVRANAYYSELWNEIDNAFTGTSGRVNIYQRENKDRTVRLGADTEARVNLPGSFFGSAGYSWAFAWDRSAGGEFYPQPAHTVKSKIGLDLKMKKTGVHTWIGARWFSPLKDPALAGTEARLILDFYFSLALKPGLSLVLGVDNITGEMDRIGPSTAQCVTVGLKYAGR